MSVFVLAALAALQSVVPPAQAPVLEFPETGLDDPAAYEGYATRFFRDSERNAFQVYLDGRSGRVVHVWADGANASAAFTVRDPAGRPVPVAWGAPGAEAASEGERRTVRHRLAAGPDAVEIGGFLLGTMRQERDFQYADRHRGPFDDPPFVLPELTDLVASLRRLPAEERARHLRLLDARDVEEVESRLEPRLAFGRNDTSWVLTVEHVGLDGRSRMTLELRGDPDSSTAELSERRLSVRARSPGGIRFDVAVSTDAPALTPLERDELFDDAFEAFLRRERATHDSLARTLPPADRARDPRIAAFRRLERDVRGLELLAYREKLMAALPNYATYFGRDGMMAALMLEPVTSAELQEHVIATVLGKLSPEGDVSHEEALGGQAIRENAAEYAARIRAWEAAGRAGPAAAERLEEARELLADLRAARENYRMVDDDFQLPVLVARWLARRDVPPERKRRFLAADARPGVSRLEALVRNLALVAERARPYAERPVATNLVGFLHRDVDGWLPGSWRDSRAGYGNGRFAMDVNAVWVPEALEASAAILGSLEELGLSAAGALARAGGDAPALEAHLAAPDRLREAIETWRGARRHFEVRLGPDAIRERVDGWLASLPSPEREYWAARFAPRRADPRPLTFLALALDDDGRPIPAPNTDPATDLLLEDHTAAVLDGATEPGRVLDALDVFLRPYPVGLFVDGLGPVVVNDVYAGPDVQARFRGDAYHSPRVVWGREVNLLFLGLARQIGSAYDEAGRPRSDREEVRDYVEALRRILEANREAVEASGLRHNELWSYRVDGGVLRPVRYGASSDIQLWNLTDLAVRFLLDRLPPPAEPTARPGPAPARDR